MTTITNGYISNLNAYALADLAECGTPDTPASPGAELLVTVRDSLLEAIADDDLTDRRLNEIADSAPSVYTHQRWAEFLDLSAYQEDTSEYGDLKDLTEVAGVALYIIAERLLHALVDGMGLEVN